MGFFYVILQMPPYLKACVDCGGVRPTRSPAGRTGRLHRARVAALRPGAGCRPGSAGPCGAHRARLRVGVAGAVSAKAGARTPVRKPVRKEKRKVRVCPRSILTGLAGAVSRGLTCPRVEAKGLKQ